MLCHVLCWIVSDGIFGDERFQSFSVVVGQPSKTCYVIKYCVHSISAPLVFDSLFVLIWNNMDFFSVGRCYSDELNGTSWTGQLLSPCPLINRSLLGVFSLTIVRVRYDWFMYVNCSLYWSDDRLSVDPIWSLQRIDVLPTSVVSTAIGLYTTWAPPASRNDITFAQSQHSYVDLSIYYWRSV